MSETVTALPKVTHKMETRKNKTIHLKVIDQITITLPKNVIDYIAITSEFVCNRLNYNYCGNVIR